MTGRLLQRRRKRSAWRDTRGAVALEFAMVAGPFFLLMLFIFEISLDLFQQEELDTALHLAARQIQTGNAQNVANGADFINQYLCPDVGTLLVCSGLYVQIQNLTLTYPQDYWNVTTGTLPMTGGALDLSAYGSANFCNAGPSEFLLISAVYVAPTIVGFFLPNLFSVQFGGATVRATISQVAAATEAYSATALGPTAAPGC